MQILMHRRLRYLGGTRRGLGDKGGPPQGGKKDRPVWRVPPLLLGQERVILQKPERGGGGGGGGKRTLRGGGQRDMAVRQIAVCSPPSLGEIPGQGKNPKELRKACRHGAINKRGEGTRVELGRREGGVDSAVRHPRTGAHISPVEVPAIQWRISF